MADCHNLTNNGLGYGKPGCNTDHPQGAPCCSTPFGPSLPNLSTGPLVTFSPYTQAQKTNMIRSFFRPPSVAQNNKS